MDRMGLRETSNMCSNCLLSSRTTGHLCLHQISYDGNNDCRLAVNSQLLKLMCVSFRLGAPSGLKQQQCYPSQQPWHCKRYTRAPHHSPSSDVGMGRPSSGDLAAFRIDILGVLALVFSTSTGILVRAFESVSRYLAARRERRGRGRKTNEACTKIECHLVTTVTTIRHTREHGKLAYTFLYRYRLQPATTVGPVHAHTS